MPNKRRIQSSRIAIRQWCASCSQSNDRV